MPVDKDTLELVKAMAAEMRKPTEVEQRELDAKEADKKAALQERKENSANVKEQMRLRRQEQMTCSHAHADGHTHLTKVIESGTLAGGPGYLLCNWCQAKVRPDNDRVKQLDPHAIFDTALFNRLLQTVPGNELFG